ncbi:hypothetical protein IJT10_07095, partial [bacterium]|nr:hypothetical protein [bacterium]
ERGVDRTVLFALFSLSLLLKSNCLIKKFSEDGIRQILDPYTEYFGICKSSQDKLIEVLRAIHILGCHNYTKGELKISKSVINVIRSISNALITLGLVEEDILLKSRGGSSGQ